MVNGTFGGGITGWIPVGWVSIVPAAPTTPNQLAAQAGGVGVLPGESGFHQVFVAGAQQHTLTMRWSGGCQDRRSWATVVLRDHSSNQVAILLTPTCRADQQWRRLQSTVQPGHTYTLSLLNHDDAVADHRSWTRFDHVALSQDRL